jgi:hypothetical protein
MACTTTRPTLGGACPAAYGRTQRRPCLPESTRASNGRRTITTLENCQAMARAAFAPSMSPEPAGPCRTSSRNCVTLVRRSGGAPRLSQQPTSRNGGPGTLGGLRAHSGISTRPPRRIRSITTPRTPVLNQRRLLHALCEYEAFYNEHRPHQGIAGIRPRAPLPAPITELDRFARLNIHRRDRLRGIVHEYEHALDLPG